MESREINLLPQKEKLGNEFIRVQDFTRKSLPIIMGIYILILAAVLGVSFYFTSQINASENQIVTEKDRIKALGNNEGIYLLLKQKISSITTIIENRQSYVELLTFFSTLPEGMSLTAIEIGENGEVTLTVTIPNSAVFDEYITKILDTAKTQFTKVELQSIGYTPGGEITLGLQIIQ